MTKDKCSVEVYSRVTGFYRPVQDWNKGKKAEHKARKHYSPVLTNKRSEEKDC